MRSLSLAVSVGARQEQLRVVRDDGVRCAQAGLCGLEERGMGYCVIREVAQTKR